jgi:hypothetical protein
MSDEKALNRLRTWESRKFMEVARWLMYAERSQAMRNVLNNFGGKLPELMAEPHERDVQGRLRDVAVSLAAGEKAATERAIQRMKRYGSFELGDLGLQAARAAGLATAWNQACLHGATKNLALARRIREEFDSVLDSFCQLLGPWEETL